MKLFSIQKIRKTVCVFVACAGLIGARGQGNVNYIPFYTETSFNAKSVDLSRTVGTVTGQASVSNGAATYTIPIMPPPRPNGSIKAPELSINYSSMGSNGALGRGCVQGVSSIQRANFTIAHNELTGPSCTNDNNNNYVWDGQKIYIKGSQNGGAINIWGTETESFALIKSFKDANGKISQWEITTKDGAIMSYGYNTRIFVQNSSGQNTSCNSSSGAYTSFYLDNIQFPNGQVRYYDYHYSSGRNVFLDRVSDDYGEIKFNYKLRSDVFYNYLNGKRFINDLLLDEIQVKNFSGLLIKKYTLKYSNDGLNSFISEINEEDNNNNKLNPTIFQYGMKNNSLQAISSNGSTVLHQSGGIGSIIKSGDFNGDGVTDLVTYNAATITQKGYTIYTAASWATNWNGNFLQSENISENSGFTVTQAENRPTYSMNADYNGDLIDDIMIQKTSVVNNQLEIDETRIDFINHLGKRANFITIPKPVYRGVVTNVIPQGVNFFHGGDFNGDGSTDYIYILTSSLGSPHKYYISFPSKNQFNYYLEGIPGSSLNLESADLIKVLDMDGDGKHELMVVKEGSTKIYSINNSSDPMLYHATEIYSGGFPTKWHKVYVTDFNGDGKSDLLTKSDASSWTVYHSNGNNFDFVSTTTLIPSRILMIMLCHPTELN